MQNLLELVPYLPLLLLMLVVLVVIHEFGHFLPAKKFGVEAPEFGIGFPPRLWTFWKTNGLIQIQGRKIVVPKNFVLPEELTTGSWVTYKTETRNGKEFLTGISPVDDESRGLVMASQVQLLDHGTQFTLNAVPLGGYVRMNEDTTSTAPNAFVSKPAWQRAIILVGGVTANLLFAFIVFTLIAMWVPQLSNPAATTTLVGVLANTPAATAGLRVNDTIVTVNGIQVRNDRERMIHELTANCQQPVQLGVDRPLPRGGTETVQVELTPRPTADLPCALGVQIDQDFGVQIGSVKPGSLAEQAGLRPGDALVRIGDFSMIPQSARTVMDLNDDQDLAAFVKNSSRVRTTLIVRYVRAGQILQSRITIPENIPADQADLGLTFHLNAWQAATYAADRMYTAITLLPRTLQRAFSNSISGQPSGVVGLVGMTQILKQTIPDGGALAALSFLIEISLSLAIFNLLPIPGLDGGRLVFVIAEMITRGRRLDPRTEGIIHMAGIFVLLLFILFIFYADVTRVLSGQVPLVP
jgi:regulator of sigma E protease